MGRDSRRTGVSRFTARERVSATFGERNLGVVAALDIGPCEDPDQLGLQYYVFSHPGRQDVVRLVSRACLADQVGRLETLTLTCDGARYRVEALCAEHHALTDGRYAVCFEAQHTAEIRADARERHGVDDLASALLLDALTED